MALLSAIAGGLIGGAFDKKAGDATNKANLLANRETINAQAANQEKSLNALQGSTPDATTTRNADGGFDTAFTRGGSSDLLAQGDVGRANAANSASSNFNFKLPDLASAQGVVDRDNSIAQSGFDKAFNQATLRERQATGGIDSGFNGRTATALGEVSDKLRTNREQTALNLFDQSRNNDTSLLQQQISANQRLAPQLNPVGATASASIAQSPPPAQIANLSGAITPAAGSNLVAQIQQQIANDEAQQRQMAFIRQLGDQGYFNGGKNVISGDKKVTE